MFWDEPVHAAPVEYGTAWWGGVHGPTEASELLDWFCWVIDIAFDDFWEPSRYRRCIFLYLMVSGILFTLFYFICSSWPLFMYHCPLKPKCFVSFWYSCSGVLRCWKMHCVFDISLFPQILMYVCEVFLINAKYFAIHQSITIGFSFAETCFSAIYLKRANIFERNLGTRRFSISPNFS